jgi:hypothetical protein
MMGDHVTRTMKTVDAEVPPVAVDSVRVALRPDRR